MYYNSSVGFFWSKGDDGIMKTMTIGKKAIAAVLACIIALSCLAACGNAQTTVRQRTENTNRGTGFHSTF